METLTIQVKNKKALQLIKDLEALDLVRVLENKLEVQESMAYKYKGKLSEISAKALDKEIEDSRNSW
ncbi:hypothetical protein EP331_05310 [bacterium]|nr:MAG: hypothetical protein EP331_05310 [bacterium]